MGTTRSLGEGRFGDLKKNKKNIRKTDLEANKSCIEFIVLYLYQKLGNKLDHIRRIRKNILTPKHPSPTHPLPLKLNGRLLNTYWRPLDSRTRTTTSTRFDLRFFRVFSNKTPRKPSLSFFSPKKWHFYLY